jgi:hypothetical protein
MLITVLIVAALCSSTVAVIRANSGAIYGGIVCMILNWLCVAAALVAFACPHIKFI